MGGGGRGWSSQTILGEKKAHPFLELTILSDSLQQDFWREFEVKTAQAKS